MARYPAAYARKSHKDQASAEQQLVEIHEIAKRDGLNGELVDYKDVGISGLYGKRGDDSDWRRLQTDIAEGRVSTVYLSVLDRAGRDLEEWLAFTRICVEHGTRVVDSKGERTGDGNEDLALFEMWAAQKEGKKAVERSARANRTMAARGYDVGHPPYGSRVAWEVGEGDARELVDKKPEKRSDVRRVFVPADDEPMQPLLDAIRETGGNVMRAASLLNDHGVLNRGREWHPRSLTRVLDRERALRLRYGRARRRAPSAAPLSRLVACHCGQIMTPTRDRRTGEWTEMYCSVGHRQGVAKHGRYVARSKPVIELLRESIGRARWVPMIEGVDTSAQRAKLDEELRRLGVAYRAGAVDDDEFTAESSRIKAARADIEDTDGHFGAPRPYVRWDGEPQELGEDLRSRVIVVHLGEDMRPTRVEWRGGGPRPRPFRPRRAA